MKVRVTVICCLVLSFAGIPAHSQLPDDWGPLGLCGGEQQPACQGLAVPAKPRCDPGYSVVDDAFPFLCQLFWGGFCWCHCRLDHEPIDEPECDCTVPSLTQDDPLDLWGFADIHAHQFTNEGFGGVSLWGEPFHWEDPNFTDGINSALAPCGWQKRFKTGFYPFDWLWVGTKDLIAERGWAVHGTTVLEIVPPTGYHLMSLIMDKRLHGPHGAPRFDDWPRFDESTHQKMYYRWLERAYKGGLRLMVNLAVNNESLCDLPIALRRKGEPGTCDDEGAIERQIDKAYELERFIDLEDDGIENGSGWYRIVLSPDDPDPERPGARQVIASGRLAVVLGVEVDSLLGCNLKNDSCNFDIDQAAAKEYIRTELDHLYDRGVRHFFPVHFLDNRFAGAALFKELFSITNLTTNGEFMELRDCSLAGVEFDAVAVQAFQGIVQEALTRIGLIPGSSVDEIMELLFGTSYIPMYAGICNATGLTDEGKFLVDELMERDMIIDTDHMSWYALDDALTKAVDYGDYGYPMVSGHTWMWEEPRVNEESDDDDDVTMTEKHRADYQIKTILRLGGMVAPIMPRKACNTTVNYAKRYRHALDLARDVPQPYGEDHPGIAFGSDFGAMFFEPGPRFGPDAEDCDPDDVGGPIEDREETRLEYPFEIFEGRGQFYKQVTGERVFDYNTDGLAQVGLLPDFMADLKNVGVAEYELEPLFRSAETYIRMWERITYCTPDQDGPEPDVVSLPTLQDECSVEVTTVPTASDVCAGEIVGTTEDPLVHSEQGTFTIEWTYTDPAGNSTVQPQTVIVDDVTPPTIESLTATPNRLWPPNHKMHEISVDVVASDNCVPAPHCSIVSVASDEPVNGTGDGDAEPDWVITGDLTVELRAERAGNGDGRVYSIDVACSDDGDNSTTASVEVRVPRGNASE